MHALPALRFQVVLLAIVALLVHASAPALHAHTPLLSGDGADWIEVCTGSGPTVLVHVDESTGERITSPVNDQSDRPAGDHHCPQCLTYGGVAPGPSASEEPARAFEDGAFADRQAPDRLLAWSAERARAPPFRG